MNKRVLAVGVAALLASAQPALAHETDGKGTLWSWMGDWSPSFYAGASLHQGAFQDWNLSRIDSASFTTRDEDDRDVGYRLSGGMTFLDYLAVEASYADFGEATFTGNSDGSGSVWAPGTLWDSVRTDGYGLHLVGRLPVAGHFALTAKAGAWSLRTEQRASGNFYDAGTPTPFSLRASGSDTKFSWGAALEYDGFEPVRIALGYDVAAFDTPGVSGVASNEEIHSVGVSLKYMFTEQPR